jgi:hypothetical protein
MAALANKNGFWNINRRDHMNGKQVGSAKIWILIAVLAAAAVAVLVFSGNFPPGEQNVTGTIVPAERFGSSQISSEDVVLGTDSNADASSPQATEGLVADAASNAGNSANAGRANDSNASNAARVLSNDSNASNAARVLSNDSNASNSARVRSNDAVLRSNDSNAANAARANDSNAANAARANDSNAANAARANDSNAANAARANDGRD